MNSILCISLPSFMHKLPFQTLIVGREILLCIDVVREDAPRHDMTLGSILSQLGNY